MYRFNENVLYLIVFALLGITIVAKSNIIPLVIDQYYNDSPTATDPYIIAELAWLTLWHVSSSITLPIAMVSNCSTYADISISSIQSDTRFMDKSIEFGLNVTLCPIVVTYRNETHICADDICATRDWTSMLMYNVENIFISFLLILFFTLSYFESIEKNKIK